MNEKHFRPLLSSAQLLPFPIPSLQCCLLLSRPLCHRVCFFSFSWLSGSEPGFVQQLALSEEHSRTKRGSRQEHLSANSRLKGSPNSLESRTDRHFLASEEGETLASNLQRGDRHHRDKPGVLERSASCMKFPSIPSRIPISICLGTRLNCVVCVTAVSAKLNLRSAPSLTTCRRQLTSKTNRFTCSQRLMR